MSVCYEQVENQHILYDPAFLEHAAPALFEPVSSAESKPAGGRGAACFVSVEGRRLLLRHYRRGGMLGHLAGDCYLWLGLERTRVWREWLLLAQLHREGLPVPQPVAGRVVRRGPFYQGDLMTAALPGAISLAARLAQEPLKAGEWKRVGRCIRRFHERGIYHPDLNAHNILVDDRGNFFLIDFDKGSSEAPWKRHWQRGNLARLHRSLVKLAGAGQLAHFRPASWEAMLEGYRETPRTIGTPAIT